MGQDSDGRKRVCVCVCVCVCQPSQFRRICRPRTPVSVRVTLHPPAGHERASFCAARFSAALSLEDPAGRVVWVVPAAAAGCLLCAPLARGRVSTEKSKEKRVLVCGELGPGWGEEKDGGLGTKPGQQ